MLGTFFLKEMFGIARKPGYYALRMAVAIVLIGSTYVHLLPKLQAAFAKPSPQISDLNAIGAELWLDWAVGISLALAFIAPLLTAGSIASERDRGTLDLVRTTAIRPHEILFGKSVSRMLVLLLCIAVTQPIIALGFLLGGFTIHDVLRALVVHVTIAFTGAAVGLYFSSKSLKPTTASLRAVTFLAFWWFFIPRVVPWLVEAIPGFQWLSTLAIVDFWNALGVRSETLVVEHGVSSILVPSAIGEYWINILKKYGWQYWPTTAFAAINFCLSLFMMRLSLASLASDVHRLEMPWLIRWIVNRFRSIVAAVRSVLDHRQHVAVVRRLLAWDRASGPFFERIWSRVIHLNPLFFRNAHANIFDPERHILHWKTVVWTICVGGTTVLAMFGSSWLLNSNGYRIALSFIGAGMIVTTFITSSAVFAREQQSGSWDLLRLANFSNFQQVSAAYVGAFHASVSFLLLMGFLCLSAIYFCDGLDKLFDASLFLWLLATTIMLAYAIVSAVLISACSQSIGQALLRAGIAAAAVFFGGPLLLQSVGNEPWLMKVLFIAMLVALLGWPIPITRRLWTLVVILPIMIAVPVEGKFRTAFPQVPSKDKSAWYVQYFGDTERELVHGGFTLESYKHVFTHWHRSSEDRVTMRNRGELRLPSWFMISRYFATVAPFAFGTMLLVVVTLMSFQWLTDPVPRRPIKDRFANIASKSRLRGIELASSKPSVGMV